MLAPRLLGELAWDAGGKRASVSAASGAVHVGRRLYVIGDDELHMAVFDAAGSTPGARFRLMPGSLPLSAGARKAVKPEFEALFLLPPSTRHTNGALLALGSGSTARRMSGALMPLDPGGAPGKPIRVDLAPLYKPLDAFVTKLNIEGAVVSFGRLLLFQRGNSAEGRNAIFGFDLTDALATFESGREPGAPITTDVALGMVDGVPLCFTDAAPLSDGRIVFTAVAEATDDPYLDGACVGAAIGILDNKLRLAALYPLVQPLKVEGVTALQGADVIDLFMVTDADDPAKPSRLYHVELLA
jgi:hypothetical protein